MNKIEIGHHISKQFDTELEDIRQRVLVMGGLVEQQIGDALRALVDVDSQLAEVVVRSDYKVNAMEVAIDEECTHIIARRQPAATDLRLVVAVIKTITDLERIGDEAERIARMALRLAEAGNGGARKYFTQIEYMGERVYKMMHEALDAFARTDPEAAVAVWRKDQRVDEEYEAIVRQLITVMMEDPRSIPVALDVMWSARALERIGDRARNICEYVIYLVRGKDVRHTSLEQIEKEAREGSRSQESPRST
ncbi:MAG TPA: phosphate signaling complex protein PhoU [Chromatiales bacterium]|nr:phosphate signaling complex protein PhoU [Chromatiales bacterium]